MCRVPREIAVFVLGLALGRASLLLVNLRRSGYEGWAKNRSRYGKKRGITSRFFKGHDLTNVDRGISFITKADTRDREGLKTAGPQGRAGAGVLIRRSQYVDVLSGRCNSCVKKRPAASHPRKGKPVVRPGRKAKGRPS